MREGATPLIMKAIVVVETLSNEADPQGDDP
jgi:hypothetical protein